MITSYFFTVTAIEKAQILVEIFIGDLVHNSLSKWNPQYEFLLWYYQFVRAESFISFTIFIAILTAILIAWWCSSYMHEEERYELFGTAFPNESLEWWYDWMVETLMLAVYFIYVGLFDLYFFWKPVAPRWFSGSRFKAVVPRQMWGERTYNIFSKLFTSVYQYKGVGWPLDYRDLERWAMDEFRAVGAVREVRKAITLNPRRPFTRVWFRTTFWFRCRKLYYKRLARILVGDDWSRSRHPAIMQLKRIQRSNIVKFPPLPKKLDFIGRRFRKKKWSKYVQYADAGYFPYYNTQRHFALKYQGYDYWRREFYKVKERWIGYVRRRTYLWRFIVFWNRHVGYSRTLTGNIVSRQKGTSRGRYWMLYYKWVRRARRLKPQEKIVYKKIYKWRKRQLHHMMWLQLKAFLRYHAWFSESDVIRKFFTPARPIWHAEFFEYYWIAGGDGSRGSQFSNFISLNKRLWFSLAIVEAIHGYCWEEDEWDMYEEEFEDWDLEFDIESGEINNSGLDWEHDEDLRSLVFSKSENILALEHAEEAQAWKDDQVWNDNREKIFDEENYDEDEEILDDDLLQMSVDYWAGVFEYFTDPQYWNLELLQLHMVIGYDMPPAWGRLQEASTYHRNLYDRVDGILYAFYYHNCVYSEDGVSTTDRWWDGADKSWRHDGQPLNFLAGINSKMAQIFSWYFTDYRETKKRNEPEIFDLMVAIDKEERAKRPHYHGMAFWRGYAKPREDAYAVWLHKFESLSPRYKHVIHIIEKEYWRRSRKGEYILDDDYERRYGEWDDSHIEKWENWEKTGKWE